METTSTLKYFTILLLCFLTILSEVSARTNDPPISEARCISSCKGKANWKYQLCGSCEYYAHCVDGMLYHKRCPKGLTWDDTRKRCVQPHRSRTCKWIAPL